jgi:S1-C subfamily serine protease
VAIDVRQSGQTLSRGSGFFVDVDRVVTNRHVIENAYRVEVHSSNGSVYQVKGFWQLRQGGFALLKIDAPRIASPFARAHFAAGGKASS